MKHKVVLIRVGDKYSVEYEENLARALARWATYKYDLEIVHTSMYPGWWAKLELFKDRPDRIVFIDLDTVILGNIDFLFEYSGEFALVRDFYRPLGFGTDVMCISAGYGRHIYENFRADAPRIMMKFPADHIYMETQAPKADILQDLYPDKIVSYKVDCKEGPPPNASIVCFHGRPKPHEFTPGTWVHKEWR